MNRKNLIILLLALTLITGLFWLSVPATASDVIHHTVNIAQATKNEEGPGYIWANRTDVLTLSNLNIDTDDAFGLRLPQDATVVLKGNNHIKASKYGISFSGTLVIKGNGSLTVEAGDIGLYLITQDTTQKIRLLDGSYTITAGTYGVYSDAADFSFVGKSMDIHVADENGAAVQGRVVNLLGGSFTSNASVQATHILTVDGISLDIEANSSALEAKTLNIKNIALKSGESYSGENTLNAVSSKSNHKSSVIFDNLPGYFDVIFLIIAIICLTLCVVLPILKKKKKAKELYARLEEEGYITSDAKTK